MTVKLIQVTDLHLPLPGHKLFGLDPYERLDACLRHIATHHADADLVIISGDLAHDGDPDAYESLRMRLQAFSPPVQLMLGNHDHRAAFRRSFPSESQAGGGFVQKAMDTAQGRIVTLDTLLEGHTEGHMCPERLSWLDERLAEALGRRAFLFLHHPPFAIGIPSLDPSRLVQGEELMDILRRHGNVEHIFAGHVHRRVSGMWNGIGYSTLTGTSHQSAANFHDGTFAVSFEAPTYSVILIDPASLAIHAVEFLDC